MANPRRPRMDGNHFTNSQARIPSGQVASTMLNVGYPVSSPLPPRKIEVLDTSIYMSLRGQCGTCNHDCGQDASPNRYAHGSQSNQLVAVARWHGFECTDLSAKGLAPDINPSDYQKGPTLPR